VPGVVEIRTYKLLAGSGAEFHRFVVEESSPMRERWGVDVLACRFVYGSDEWRDGPREAIVSLIESSIPVVLPAESLG
jgi:hypothetical protein